MPIQTLGNDGVSVTEVDAKWLAQRATLRPLDYGTLGAYSICGVTGVMAAGLAANSEVFQLRYTGPNVLLIEEVKFDGLGSIVAFAAGVISMQLFRAAGWSVDGSGGTALTLTGDNNKLKTSMPKSLSADTIARASSTAALTAGTKTLNINPLGSLQNGVATATGGTGIPEGALFKPIAGQYPIALVNQEGIVIRATVPITGTWTAGFTIRLIELTAAQWAG